MYRHLYRGTGIKFAWPGAGLSHTVQSYFLLPLMKMRAQPKMAQALFSQLKILSKILPEARR